MRYDEFKPLLETLRYSPFTKDQLGELLGEVVGRICRMQDVPELEETQIDLSASHEGYRDALERIAARESAGAGPDECDLAKTRRAIEEAV